ncbi:hypothetical protein [Streptomyces sp. NBC_01727]|uniref:hypothetical protein n=1 Tax=Streptomyces sp. NBC_01727 TaxID=2975924 RepID=UPI002E167654|nr:hypothetical protein OIE76_07660 [Streptomyces sp. NBC_01727]
MVAIPSTADTAFLRVASSESPDRFLRLVHFLEAVVTDGTADLETAAWNTDDPLLLAAQIEAMAGVRRRTALSHSPRCQCDACRVRTRLAKIQKEQR